MPEKKGKNTYRFRNMKPWENGVKRDGSRIYIVVVGEVVLVDMAAFVIRRRE